MSQAVICTIHITSACDVAETLTDRTSSLEDVDHTILTTVIPTSLLFHCVDGLLISGLITECSNVTISSGIVSSTIKLGFHIALRNFFFSLFLLNFLDNIEQRVTHNLRLCWDLGSDSWPYRIIGWSLRQGSRNLWDD